MHTMVFRSDFPKGKLVTITALSEEISWTIPSFPVLTLKLVIVELEDGSLGIIKIGDKTRLTSFPATIDCWSTECNITIGVISYMVLWDWEVCFHNKLKTQGDEEQNGDFPDSPFGLNKHAHGSKESSSSGLENQIDEAQNNDFLDSLLALNENSHRSEESSNSGFLENQTNKPHKHDFIDSLLALDKPAHIPLESPGSEPCESVSSDVEDSNCSHELPFKVMGVAHNAHRQKIKIACIPFFV